LEVKIKDNIEQIASTAKGLANLNLSKIEDREAFDKTRRALQEINPLATELVALTNKWISTTQRDTPEKNTGKENQEKAKKNKTKWIIGLALAWFALLTSHNLMVLIFAPIFLVWLLLHMWQQKSFKRIPQLVTSGILAFGLAAFFTLPALLENKFTQIESVLTGYYDFTAHFVSVGQLLFSRFWGYGPSVWGIKDDRMSFQVGHVHWLLALFIGTLIIVKISKLKKAERK